MFINILAIESKFVVLRTSCDCLLQSSQEYLLYLLPLLKLLVLYLQEVATVLIRLYQQYTFELLHPEQQVPLPLKHTFALIPAQGLKVRVHKRGR